MLLNLINQFVSIRISSQSTRPSLLDLPVELQDLLFAIVRRADVQDFFRLAASCSYLKKRILQFSLWEIQPHEWFKISGQQYHQHSGLASIPFAYQSQFLKSFPHLWQTGRPYDIYIPLNHVSYVEMTVKQDMENLSVPIELGLLHGGCLSFNKKINPMTGQANVYNGWDSELAIVTFSSNGEVGLFFESLMPMSDPQISTIPWAKGDVVGIGMSLDHNMIFVTLNGQFLLQSPTHVLRGFDSVDWVPVNYCKKQWMVQLVSPVPFAHEMNFGTRPYSFDLSRLFPSKKDSQMKKNVNNDLRGSDNHSAVWKSVGSHLLHSKSAHAHDALRLPTIQACSTNEYYIQFESLRDLVGKSFRSAFLSVPNLSQVDYFYMEVLVTENLYDQRQNEVADMDVDEDDRTLMVHEASSQDKLALGIIQGPCLSPFGMVGMAPRSLGYAIDSRKILNEGAHCSVLNFGEELNFRKGTIIGFGYYPKERIIFFTRQGDRIGPRMIFRDYSERLNETRSDIHMPDQSCYPVISSSMKMSVRVRTASVSRGSSHRLDSNLFAYTDDPSTEWVNHKYA